MSLLVLCSFLNAKLFADDVEEYNELLYQARALFNQGRLEDAISAYEKAEELFFPSKEAIFNQAVIYKNMRAYPKAVEKYKQLLSIQPDRIIYFNLGEIYYLEGMPKEAVAAFNQAIASGMNDARVYFYLGKCFEGLNDKQAAVRAYRESVAIDDAFVLSHAALGKIYEQEKAWASAQKEYEQVRELDPSIKQVYPVLAMVYYNQERYELALGAFRKVQAVDPGNTQAQVFIDKIYEKMDKDKKDGLSKRQSEKFSLSIAKEVPPVEVKDAIAVALHIADTKNLRFKCCALFYIKNKKNNEVVFKGNPDILYTITLGKTGIVISNGEQSVNLDEDIMIWHDNPKATFLLFGIEAGKGEYWASKTDRIYRGKIKISVYEKKYLRIINEVDMEEYLRGVLPSEMDNSWPMEALKAQAIAARSEAYKKIQRHAKENFNFCCEVHCQVYGGASVETEATNRAVDMTDGIVAVYEDKPIDAVYSNSCGGHTQDNIFGERSEIVYLKGRPTAMRPMAFDFPLSALELEDWLLSTTIPVYCNNEKFSRRSNFRWMRIYSREELEALINKKMDIGRLVAIDIIERNRSAHIQSIRITGSKGKFTVEKELNIRQLLGDLRSGMFNINIKCAKDGSAEEFMFYGGGWGHAVGMCQVGAASMAEQGYTYDQILKFYFNQIELKKLY
ncbi:MAG: SpoIID/LytB domain-containing protein [Candidatus Omnitrophica bacterium]|nr:SpoIID/LytB domain-containing protein [Candidatus Omnitrophota bacterium]